MKKKEIIIVYEEYQSGDKLPDSDKELIEDAKTALLSSYAPYSEFHVGAALRLSNGMIVTGSNQENSAYPSGLCAERVALFHAKAAYPEADVEAIAITCKADNFTSDEPVAPCGSCRQVIAETEKRQDGNIRIIMTGENMVTKIVEGIDSLLPMKFQENRLEKAYRISKKK